MVASILCLLVPVAALVPRVQLGPRNVARTSARAAVVTMETFPHVKSVHQALTAFDAAYPRPIISIWRSPLSDMLQVTHLSLVDGRFAYDPLFAYGYMETYDLLLSTYPVMGEKDKLIDATLVALDLDPATIRADAAAVSAYVAGKTEADIFAAAAAGTDAIGAVVTGIKAKGEELLHTRAQNAGMLFIMDAVGVKPDNESLERWCAAMGLRKRNVERDSSLRKELKEKITQAMQMIKQMEIREKKVMAEKLEEKAKAAQDKADLATKAATA